MPKEDYLLKFLEKLSRVVAAMLGLREKGFPEDALRLADETFRELLDFNLAELSVMPVEEFIGLVREKGYSPTYLEALAQLSLQSAETYISMNQNGLARLFHVKALQLYYLLNEKDKTFSFEREIMISSLEEKTGKP
ncbi:MAG TPA: hypothetical protein VK152_01900 [Paludibacter sp.]|nr:hypothetical protein [Paludibacter sp.]